MATNIRVLMARKGLGPGIVWDQAGISRSRWYRIMSNPKSATVRELESIAGVLGCEPADLTGWGAAA